VIKFRIIAVGKNKDQWVADGIAHFEKLLSRWARLDWTVIPSVRSKNLSPAEVKRVEAERLTKHLARGLTVALTDKGQAHDSLALARKLEQWQTRSGGTIQFVIGGPYGLDSAILNQADIQLSLSPLTLSHQIVRLVLAEQLYRAFSILQGTGYHK
jgi:23S rRNA (pseudouridine1915-N3)-methyltransferase